MEEFVAKEIEALKMQSYYEGSRLLIEDFEKSVDTFMKRFIPCMQAIQNQLAEQLIIGVIVLDFAQLFVIRRLLNDGHVVIAITPNRGTAAAICCRKSEIPLFADEVTPEEADEFEFDVIVQFQVDYVRWKELSEGERLLACYGFAVGCNTEESSVVFETEQIVHLDKEQ